MTCYFPLLIVNGLLAVFCQGTSANGGKATGALPCLGFRAGGEPSGEQHDANDPKRHDDRVAGDSDIESLDISGKPFYIFFWGFLAPIQRMVDLICRMTTLRQLIMVVILWMDEILHHLRSPGMLIPR